MNKKLMLLVMLILSINCQAQNKFEQFVKQFQDITIPIDSIQKFPVADTIHIPLFNWILWGSQPKVVVSGKEKTVRPKVYKEGKLIELFSYGKASESGMNYETIDGKAGKFFTRIYAVGRIRLHPDYITVITKTFSSELAYYDLYSFTKEGVRLSAVPLFTYAHDDMLVDHIDYVFTKTKILNDGSIIWHEDNRGLKISRVYKLRGDGYFEIVKEEKMGKFEY